MKVLAKTHHFPIRCSFSHHGKVRSAYWLDYRDSHRLCEQFGTYWNELGVMVISDRISAFECNWRGGLAGVPGKGAALNAISEYWFEEFQKAGIGDHHIVHVPHPLVWVVKKARPIHFEGIVRHYLAGSMARDYAKGQRWFCGNQLPPGLSKNEKLMDPIITPTTKGILHIPDVPEEEDTPVSMEFVASHRVDFGLDNILDVWKISRMIQEGANLISRRMAEVGQLFVDTKFEFGYVGLNLIFMDEGGTPDSSRFWSTEEYQNGKIVESSKEGFRQFLLRELDSEILTDPKRMDERKKLAADFDVPITQMMEVSDTYKKLALDITGKEVPVVENPEEEVMDALADLGILN